MASGMDQWLGKLEGHNEIGKALTDQLQKAEDEVQQFIGGQRALKVTAEKVGALGAVVEEDLNAGKLNFDSELKASEYVKRMIVRAREAILNLADGAKSKEIAAAGKVSALTESRKIVMQHVLAAKARAEQLQAAKEEAALVVKESLEKEQTTKGRRRISGQHPGNSSLDARRDEAAKEKAPVERAKPRGRPKKGTNKKAQG